MGAFSGLRIPYDNTHSPREADLPDPKLPAINEWAVLSSNTPYNYPWGRKTRNPVFIGPFLKETNG